MLSLTKGGMSVITRLQKQELIQHAIDDLLLNKVTLTEDMKICAMGR